MPIEEENKNLFVSVICGTIFGLGWWLLIDIFAYYPESFTQVNGSLFLPAVLSTISLIGNNLIPNSSLQEAYTVTRTIFCQRFGFFFTMTLGFAGILIALVACSVIQQEDFPLYARIGIPFQNGMILASNLVFKFCTTDGTEDV